MKYDNRSFLYCMFFLMSASANADADTTEPVTVLADGGLYFADNYAPYRALELKIFCIRPADTSISVIRGEVTHPYGEGPFEVAPTGVIEDFVFSAEGSTVAFELHFGMQPPPDELTTLLVAKPVMPKERPNRPVGVYPRPVQWETLEVLDTNSEALPFRGHVDPVFTWGDVGWFKYVLPTGFPDKPVSVAIHAVNGVEVYKPSWTLKRSSTDPESFYVDSFEETKLWPFTITFEVVLADGSVYLIDVAEFKYHTYLSPPSAIPDWWTEYR